MKKLLRAALLVSAAGLAASYWRLARAGPGGTYRVSHSGTAWGEVWKPVADGKRPLLILSPAMGRGPGDYDFFGFELASQGFVVAGVQPPHPVAIDIEQRVRSQPDIEAWVEAIQRARGQIRQDPELAPHIDFARVGIFGHSFGGATAVHLLKRDPSIRRAVNLDGATWGTPIHALDRPVLFVMGAPLPPSQAALNDEIMEEFRAICRSSTAECRIEERPRAGHMNFSDRGLFTPPIAAVRAHMGVSDIDGRSFLQEIAMLMRTFFEPIE